MSKFNDKLKNIVVTKIKTTMIGAISIIEKTIEESNLSNREKEQFLKLLQNTIRPNILDKGNTQIRNIEKELENYEVKPKLYTVIMEVKPRPYIRTEQENRNDKE